MNCDPLLCISLDKMLHVKNVFNYNLLVITKIAEFAKQYCMISLHAVNQNIDLCPSLVCAELYYINVFHKIV